ncbi:MAG: DegV family protein [Christensenellaceae bacterium]|nr:DegV family protein [Christensenellaceae bacterium]MDD6926804.1 DegV family protein [bacterium]MDY2851611.1 DegV family protein [Christensenellaceae bacterium]
MKNVVITVDSTADFSKEIIEKYDIRVSPLHVLLGDNEYRDGVDATPQDIFEYVKKTNVLPKTSACATEEYVEFFTRQLEEAEKVIHFNISAECSSSNANAVEAAKRFGGRVYVVDTRQLSTGQGLLALKACDLLQEGKTVDEVYNTVLSLTDKVQTSFVVDTVDYLYKGGRCTAAAAVVSKILKIHPSIFMDNGKLVVRKKYMGNLKRCIGAYVDDLAVDFPDYDDTRVFITHSHCSDDIVELIKEKVKEKFSFKDIEVTTAGCVVTSHCGQGTLGVLYIKK